MVYPGYYPPFIVRDTLCLANHPVTYGNAMTFSNRELKQRFNIILTHIYTEYSGLWFESDDLRRYMTTLEVIWRVVTDRGGVGMLRLAPDMLEFFERAQHRFQDQQPQLALEFQPRGQPASIMPSGPQREIVIRNQSGQQGRPQRDREAERDARKNAEKKQEAEAEYRDKEFQARKEADESKEKARVAEEARKTEEHIDKMFEETKEKVSKDMRIKAAHEKKYQEEMWKQAEVKRKREEKDRELDAMFEQSSLGPVRPFQYEHCTSDRPQSHQLRSPPYGREQLQLEAPRQLQLEAAPRERDTPRRTEDDWEQDTQRYPNDHRGRDTSRSSKDYMGRDTQRHADEYRGPAMPRYPDNNRERDAPRHDIDYNSRRNEPEPNASRHRIKDIDSDDEEKRFDPYAALGLENREQTSAGDIRITKRKLEEKYNDGQQASKERLAEIKMATDILLDPEWKRAYHEVGAVYKGDFEAWRKRSKFVIY
jgi:hypothetical protein